MRIRNRKAPFPISSLRPVPILSDLCFRESSVVQRQLDKSQTRAANDEACLLDLTPPETQPINGVEDNAASLKEDGSSEEIRLGRKIRRVDEFGGKIECAIVKETRSSSDQGSANSEEDAKNKSRMEEGVQSKTKRGRKRGRGSAIMDGSRCSRVNGRGWRCCQQTLVGYSLCEHHLGKGRIRTMGSKSKTMIPATSDEKEGNTPRKKMKLGVVKARSLSSLLGIAK